MKKNMWKRLLTAGCVATLLMTSPGMTALANEIDGREDVVNFVMDESIDDAGEAVDGIDVENANDYPTDDSSWDIKAEEETEDADDIDSESISDYPTDDSVWEDKKDSSNEDDYAEMRNDSVSLEELEDYDSSRDTSVEESVSDIDLLEADTLADESISSSMVGASPNYSEAIVYLKDGNYIKWIDRVNLPEYAIALYENMVEASDNDGTKDWMIEPSYVPKDSEGDYSYTITEFSGSSNDYSNMINDIDTKFSNIKTAAQTAYSAFSMDHPEIFWLSNKSKIARIVDYNEVNGQYKYTCKVVLKLATKDYDIRCESFCNSADIKKGINRLKKAVSSIVGSATGDEEQKITYFNDWLTKNNEYNRVLSNGGKESYFTHLPLCALEGNKGDNGPVCQGYASAFKVLCDAAGIPCVLNSGMAITSEGNNKPHEWNYVQLGEKWYAVDVTWNDAYINNKDTNGRHEYLLVGADTIGDGKPFLQTHPISNQITEDGISFTNGPEITQIAKKRSFYPETDSWNIRNYTVNKIPLTRETYDAIMYACGDDVAAKAFWEHLINPFVDRLKFSDLKHLIFPYYDGLCYGIALSSILVNENKISLETIQDDISCLYEAEKSKNAESVIGYCFLLQYMNYYKDIENDFNKLNNRDKVNKLVNSEFPVLLTFGANGHGYHGVVGYELEYGKWSYHGNTFDARVKTADSNYPYSPTKEHSSEYYFYLNTQSGAWEIPHYNSKGYNSKDGVFTAIVEDMEWYNGLNVEDLISDYRSYKTKVRTRIKNALLLNYGDKSYTVNGENSWDNGSITASYDIGINESTDALSVLNINMKKSADISIEPTDSNEQLDINALMENSYVSLLGETYKKAVIKTDSAVEVTGIDGEYVMSFTKNGNSLPWDKISFSGKNASEISTKFENGGIVIYSDELKDITIVATNGSMDISAEPASNEKSIFVTEKNNHIEVYEDLNHDGKYTDSVSIEEEFFGGKASGTCGTEAKWHLSNDGVLTIYGKGEMSWEGSSAPWNIYCSDIKKVNVSSGITNIANRAFYECYNLTSVNMPDSVTVIGANAFFGCLSLVDVTLSQNITEIQVTAFSNCKSLKKISLPQKLTSLGQGSFYKCTSLSAVVIPGSVKEVGDSAFDSCSSLNKVVVSDGVQEIGPGAFYKCLNLKSVTLPKSIKYMGSSAFYNCFELKTAGPSTSKANIKYGWTTEFPKDAFYGCTGLTEITLPSSLTAIPDNAFTNCKRLTSITIGENIESIGESAFASCTGLSKIVFPNKAIEFDDEVFEGCTGLKSVSIPDKMTTLGLGMFKGCSSLSNVTLSKQISFIPSSVFENCTGLKTVSIPKNVKGFGYCAFGGCTNLSTINVPLTVTNIYKNAFSGCGKLTDVYYAGTQKLWKTINILEGNDNLTKANIHYVPDQDLRNCEVTLSKTQYTYNGEEKKPTVTVKFLEKTLKNGTDYSVTYKNNKNAGTAKVVLKGIGSFEGTIEKSFTIKKAKQTVSAKPWIDELPVNNMTEITTTGIGSVEFKSSDESIATIDWGRMVVGNKAGTVTITVSFSGGTNYLPASTSFTMRIVETYEVDSGSCGDDAIWSYYNNGIVRITGTGMITLVRSEWGGTYNWDKYNNIDFYFSNNYDNYQKVRLIIIEDGITAIDDETFAVKGTGMCGKMSDSPEEIIIPDTVESIGNDVFYKCSNLKTLQIGSGLSKVGNNAFSYCTSLEQINVSEKNNYFRSIDGILYDKNKTEVYKVPAACGLTNYKIPDGVKTICFDAVGDVTSLRTVSIPQSVKTIDKYAFDGCTGITDVYYAGSKSDWESINIESGNTPLTNAKIHFAIEEIDVSKCSVSLSQTAYTYDGKTKSPAVTVKYGNTVLKKGTDYTVAYSNNKNAGTATVKVSGKGNYTGSKSISFTITKATPKLTFASSNISKKTTDAAFTNVLTKTTDGTITFSSSDTKVAEVDKISGQVTIKGIGTTTITASAAAGKNYKAGSGSYTLTVEDGRIDISTCTLTLSKTSYTYSGSARKPAVTVKDGSTTLVSGTDYTVSYKNNKNAGTATVIVTGKGSYTGAKKKTFSIRKAAPVLTFAEKTVSRSTLDESFTNELTKKTDGAVTFTSNDTEIASVDGTSGLVTIKGAGTAVITASAAAGKNYTAGNATYALTVTPVSIEKASVAGVSLSYGYSGKAYTPKLTVKVNGKTLIKDTDYTAVYEDNKDPGTATITITGIGNYTGTRIKTFEIVDCVSSLVSGRTYQIIPKNNSSTAVCSYSGRMLNNTKVYITDRSSSEAMRFKAVKAADGTWKFINAKCELALAVLENSSEAGKGLILYDQSTNKAQNWKLSRKSDNSFAITNAVSGLYVSMSDMSAPKGTLLTMHENSGRGDQRFYIVETSAVSAPFDGSYAVKASKNKAYGLNIASSSKKDGANVNLYKYSNINAKKFKVMYSGGGYYRLVNVNSGLVLTVKGNTKANGANVIQSKWAAQSGQRWKITKNSNGSVTLKNALGTVLHLNGNKTVDGTNVVARNASTTGAQMWYLG